MKRFSEIADEKSQLSGEKTTIESVLNKEIIVKGFRIAKSKYPKNESGNYLTIQFEMNEEEHVLFTSSQVLINQAVKYEEHLPFLAEIVRVNKYYTFN
jgi:hypothetical protein